MKQMNWQTFQTQFPDKAANYPGGEQAYMQSNREAELAWSGGLTGPKQNALSSSNPQGVKYPNTNYAIYNSELAQGGGGQHPLIALGLGAYQGQGPKQSLENIPEPIMQGGWKPQQILGGPQHTGISHPPQGPPRGGQPFTGNPFAPPPSNPIPQWGSEVMKGFGEFGETLGGYGDKLGGFGEQLGGFGNQITGFNEQFSNINNKLQNMEEGITGLTNKLNNQQQTQSSQPYSNPYQGLQSMLYGNYGGYQSPFTNNYSFY